MDKGAICYDPGVDAAYWTLTGQPVARTIAVTDAVNVDLDADGNVTGIEVIGLPGAPMVWITPEAE